MVIISLQSPQSKNLHKHNTQKQKKHQIHHIFNILHACDLRTYYYIIPFKRKETMLEMIANKKLGDDENYRKRHGKERVSLLGDTRSNNNNSTRRLKTRDNRKTKATAHSDPSNNEEEERVSLLNDGGGTGNNKSKNTFLSAGARTKRNSKYNKGSNNNFTTRALSRPMKYAAILLVSAMSSFLLLRNQSKVIHWDEYHNILEPEESKAEPRCFVSNTLSNTLPFDLAFFIHFTYLFTFHFLELLKINQEESRSSIDERCSCPDPNKALGNETSSLWKSNHERIVYQAQNAPDDLDIVVRERDT